MSEQTTLTPHAVITQGEQQVSTIVDGVTVMMDVGNGKYYKMDDIGSRVWNLIEKPITVSAVCDQLVQEFEVERSTCEEDVGALLKGLLQHNLIRVASNA
jgi:Coenzyme PQQ synthesis protein D (PqqD)